MSGPVRPVLREFVTVSSGKDDPEAHKVDEFENGQTVVQTG